MNFLLIGPPGSGKTTLACTYKHPTLLIDVDRKASQMFNLRPLIERNLLTILPVKARLVSDTMRFRAEDPTRPPKEMPMGYLNTVDLLNEIIDDSDGEYKEYKTIVLDSLTRVSEHLKRLLIYHRGKGKFGKKIEDDLNWPSWGSYLSNLEELFSVMCLEQEDKNFICTVHMKTMTEKQVIVGADGSGIEQEIVTGYKPLIDGQMRDKLVGYFNEAYYMEPKESKGRETEWRIRTRGPKFDARTSMKLDELEPANLAKIVEKAENESKIK